LRWNAEGAMLIEIDHAFDLFYAGEAGKVFIEE
jgi:hypothetical protein